MKFKPFFLDKLLGSVVFSATVIRFSLMPQYQMTAFLSIIKDGVLMAWGGLLLLLSSPILLVVRLVHP